MLHSAGEGSILLVLGNSQPEHDCSLPSRGQNAYCNFSFYSDIVTIEAIEKPGNGLRDSAQGWPPSQWLFLFGGR